jgi:hypothetical protein
MKHVRLLRSRLTIDHILVDVTPHTVIVLGEGSMKGGHQKGHPEYEGDEGRIRYKTPGVRT